MARHSEPSDGDHLPPSLEFVGAREYELEKVLQLCGFEAMHAVEMAGANETLRLYGMRNGDPESLKVRKGRIGGYTQYLSESVITEAARIATAYGLAFVDKS
jgi:hypothetical protein